MYRRTSLLTFVLQIQPLHIVGCGLISEEPKPEEPLVTNEHKKLIRAIATENGFDASIPIDSFIDYEYSEWPDPYVETNFLALRAFQWNEFLKLYSLHDRFA